jgi:HTH-type transcriptional regulator/antitoxin HigA
VKLDEVKIKKDIYSIMPVNDMVKKGWIPAGCSANELLKCVKKIWGTSSIEEILGIMKSKPLPAFRKADKDSFSTNYSQTWLKIAENIADTIKAPVYKPDVFEEICSRANEYTMKKNGIEEFLADINKAGVKFFVLPHLKKTYIDGAAFMHKKNPVIVYTGRYDRVDNFWFTMLREAGHVLKHLKAGKQTFVDDLSNLEGSKEMEADKFSRDELKIDEILRRFDSNFNNRLSWILAVSRDLQVSSAVVVGSLQKNNRLTYRSRVLSEIKEIVTDKIDRVHIPNVNQVCLLN